MEQASICRKIIEIVPFTRLSSYEFDVKEFSLYQDKVGQISISVMMA